MGDVRVGNKGGNAYEVPIINQSQIEMSNEVYLKSIEEAAKKIKTTAEVVKQLFPQHSVPDIAKICLYAKFIGIDPLAALNGGIFLINGKAEISARSMQSLLLSRGYKVKIVKLDDTICELEGIGADNTCIGKSSFSIAQAREAGLTSKPIWKQYPEDMLFARCISRLCRRVFPDIFVEGVYTAGELSGEKNPDFNPESCRPYDKTVDKIDEIVDVNVISSEKVCDGRNSYECGCDLDKVPDEKIEDDVEDPAIARTVSKDEIEEARAEYTKEKRIAEFKSLLSQNNVPSEILEKISKYIKKIYKNASSCTSKNIADFADLLTDAEVSNMTKRIKSAM